MCACVRTCVYVFCRHVHATECTWWREDDVWCHRVSDRASCSLPQTSWPKASDCPPSLLLPPSHQSCWDCSCAATSAFTPILGSTQAHGVIQKVRYPLGRLLALGPCVVGKCVSHWATSRPRVCLLHSKCITRWTISRPCMPFHSSEMLNS